METRAFPPVWECLSKIHFMQNYSVVICWSDDDQAFVAAVPELPGYAAHGQSQESALAHAKEAMKAWLATAQEYGDPIPRPKGDG